MTRMPRPAKRSRVCLGATARATSCTWALTPAKSTPNRTALMPMRAPSRSACARAAISPRARMGTPMPPLRALSMGPWVTSTTGAPQAAAAAAAARPPAVAPITQMSGSSCCLSCCAIIVPKPVGAPADAAPPQKSPATVSVPSPHPTPILYMPIRAGPILREPGVGNRGRRNDSRSRPQDRVFAVLPFTLTGREGSRISRANRAPAH